MILTNLLFEVVSLSNLTLFLHRVIDDGQYHSVNLYSNEFLRRDTNFMQQFNNFSSRYFKTVMHPIALKPFARRFEVGLLNIYIVYDKNPNNIHGMDYFIKNSFSAVGDTLFVLPQQNRRQKSKILNIQTFVNARVVFYQTPQTLKSHISEKPTEVFQLNWAHHFISKNHISEIIIITNLSDRVHNVQTQMFEPSGRTVLLSRPIMDGWQQREVYNPKRIMSHSKDIYMMNYIAHNSKVIVWQSVYSGPDSSYTFSISDEKIYRELFISSPNKTSIEEIEEKLFGAFVLIEPVQSHLSRVHFPLYPHEAVDFVFLILQFGQTKIIGMTSSAIPLLQWLAIIILCSFILSALRKFAGERNDYSASLLDSVAIFLGNSINRLTNSRPERCFFVGFAFFGLIFKNILTGTLFLMYQQQNDQRISTIKQLIQLNIPIVADIEEFDELNRFINLCIGKPEKCFKAKTAPLTPRSLMANETFAFYTSRKAAEIYLMNIKGYLMEYDINYYDAYILEEANDRLYIRYMLMSKPMEFDRLNKMVQTCVESGIHQFYGRWESYLRRLDLQKVEEKYPQNSTADMITMDHIWIYIYGYFLAMGLCTLVFVGEHLHFRRKRILEAADRLRVTIWRLIKRILIDGRRFASAAFARFRHLLRRMQKKILPFSMMPTARRTMRINRVTPIQRA